MNTLIKHICKNKREVYFVSPHFDDVAFSAGAFIIELVSLGVKVNVINVFTQATSPSTLSGKAFLKKCNYKSPEDLYLDRVKEDTDALIGIGVTKIFNLGYEDALWRKSGASSPLYKHNHVYPTFRFHVSSGKISPKDSSLLNDIEKKINNLVGKDAIIFGPLGIGNHVDHVIVHNVLSRISQEKVFWLDFPYSQYSDSAKSSFPKFSFKKNKSKKLNLIHAYKSQINAIFGNQIILEDETYYSQIPSLNPSVSICIPAHNEEQSIGQLLESLSLQEVNNFKILEIIVYCDGCTDNTHEIVKSKAIKDKRIKMVISKTRSGLAIGQNRLFKNSQGDIVILLNSDIKIIDTSFVEKISAQVSSGADLVSAKLTPMPPKSFFEKVLYKGTILKEKSFEDQNSGFNLLTCHGPVRAFSRKLAKKIVFKFDSGEDAYSYLYALKNKFVYKYTHETGVLYRLPDNFVDYLNQSKRFSKSSSLNLKEFGRSFYEKNANIHYRWFLKTIIMHPLFSAINIVYITLYFLVYIVTKTLPQTTPDNKWQPVNSTKKL